MEMRENCDIHTSKIFIASSTVSTILLVRLEDVWLRDLFGLFGCLIVEGIEEK